jgi:hypothetical protein
MYGGEERCIQRFGRRTLRESDHFEDLVVNGWIILEWGLKSGMGAWTRLIWLKIWTGGRLLCMR